MTATDDVFPAAPHSPHDGPQAPGRRRRLRLHVDWTACEGRGHCAELLPELFGVDPWGYPVARDGSRDPVVAPALVEHAERAVASCPRLALRLLEG